ncbi:MAG: tRNA (guanine(10)-N(2))-dimethyltransferase [Candidatus Anstonellaceae archaeon]
MLSMQQINEGLSKIILLDGVFFNPKMKTCRDISSLWISILPKINILIDGFCASGIRGIRYKLENNNVKSLIFFDRSKKAIKNTKENLKLNKLKGEIFEGNSNQFFTNYQNFDFCEIDPFGSPAYYLDSVFWADWKQKRRFISITATDTAILCGAHKNACIKIYHSKPAHNFVCHEIGLRILLGFIAKTASKYDWGIIPHLTFYSLHFFKVFLEIEKSASKAISSVKNSNFFYLFCQNCFYQTFSSTPGFEKYCPVCGKTLSYAGPLWGGDLAKKNILEKMIKNYKTKKFLQSKELEKFLLTFKEEINVPYIYFDIHSLCSKYKLKPPALNKLLENLAKHGFLASRTTFSQTAIRTNASVLELIEIIKNLNSGAQNL